jgi:hypothetical protein
MQNPRIMAMTGLLTLAQAAVSAAWARSYSALASGVVRSAAN